MRTIQAHSHTNAENNKISYEAYDKKDKYQFIDISAET